MNKTSCSAGRARWKAALVALLSFAPAPAWAAPSPARLEEAAAQLGEADFETRERATKLLWSAGGAAEAALQKAVDAGPPEAASRASSLLRKIRSGIDPRTPDDVVDMVSTYRESAAGLKLDVARRLMQRGQPAARPLTRLWTSETNADVKRQLTNLLADRAGLYTVTLLADGDEAAASLLLETAAGGAAKSARDYAAYLLVRGKAAEAVEFAPPATRGWLLLASGQLDAAAKLAAERRDPDLLTATRWMKGDWAPLAAQFDTQSGKDPLTSLCMATAFHRLAGNATEVEAHLKKLNDYVQRNPDAAYPAAEVMLLAGRVDAGIALLKSQTPIVAFELLCQSLLFDEAFKLVDAAPPNEARSAGLYLAAARWRYRLGEPDAARGLCSKAMAAANDNQPNDWVLTDVVRMDVQFGRRDAAVQRVLSAKVLAGGMVGALFPDRTEAARIWWSVIDSQHPGETPKANFNRLERLLDGKAAPDELSRWAAAARGILPAMKDAYQQARWTRVLIETLLDYQREEEAANCLALLDDSAAEGDAAMTLGRHAMKKERWGEAADYFQLARDATPSPALATYLQGWATKRSGDATEGDRLMSLARVLPLSDVAARAALADGLQAAGLTEQAGAERDVILRLADFQSHEVANAARHAAVRAGQRGDHLQSADDFERALVMVYLPQTAFTEPVAYLALPRAASDARARAKLKAGDVAGAWADIEKSARVLPSDTDWMIRWVLDLEKAGQAEKAKKLFDEGFTTVGRIVEQHPRSALYHNAIAWLSARCGRELDQGLAHAKQAAELDPKNPAVIDTLAETHHRRGEKAEAIEAMKRCLALDPDSAYYHAQLKRFESPTPVEWDGPE